MGTDRNSVSSLDGGSKSTFKNSDVCHFYLLDFCPHDLFPNTKSDLGPCPKKHSDAFREQFLADPDHDYYARRYEREFIDVLQRLVDSVEQRIRKGNERILGPDESRLEQDKQKKVDAFKQEIFQLLAQAQEAGEKGNIAEAEVLTRKTTEVRCSLDRLNSTSTNYLASLSAQEKSLRVCPVCGAMQSLGDAASRFESHVTGKQHVGYERIRSTLAALRARHGPVGSKTGGPKISGDGTSRTNDDKDTLSTKPVSDDAEEPSKTKTVVETRSHTPSPIRRSRTCKTRQRSVARDRARSTSGHRSRDRSRDHSRDHSLSRRYGHGHRSRSRSPCYRDEDRGRRQTSRRHPASPDRYSQEYSHSRYRRHRKDNEYYEGRYNGHRHYHPSRQDSERSSYKYRSSYDSKRKQNHYDNRSDAYDPKSHQSESLRRSDIAESSPHEAHNSDESQSHAESLHVTASEPEKS